jgi:hypothetical protein
MALTVELPADTERALRELASARGQEPAEVALDILQQGVTQRTLAAGVPQTAWTLTTRRPSKRVQPE